MFQGVNLKFIFSIKNSQNLLEFSKMFSLKVEVKRNTSNLGL